MNTISHELIGFVREHTGEKYAFGRLQQSVSQHECPDYMIMKYATAFSCCTPSSTEKWNLLKEKFWQQYRPEVVRLCECDKVTRAHPLQTEGSDELFDLLATAYRRGLLGDYSLRYISCWIAESMELGMRQRSIYNKLERFK